MKFKNKIIPVEGILSTTTVYQQHLFSQNIFYNVKDIFYIIYDYERPKPDRGNKWYAAFYYDMLCCVLQSCVELCTTFHVVLIYALLCPVVLCSKVLCYSQLNEEHCECATVTDRVL